MTDINKRLEILSSLTLAARPSRLVLESLAAFDENEKAQLLKLANVHHVLVRALNAINKWSEEMGFRELGEWAEISAESEGARIAATLRKLAEICDGLERAGCPVTVLKSLDHWPDVGRDLDLYTSADMETVKGVLSRQFNGKVLPRSLGDCLANKCSFTVPGLDRTIEMHSGRLGQAGEHVTIAARVEGRRIARTIAGHTYYTPAAEEQIMAATMQRMYRHLFFRICDIVNVASLIEAGAVDYRELQDAAKQACIWSGVSTFLVIVSDYVKQYRGTALPLPNDVIASALFGADKFFVRGQFLRVPLLPEAAGLYARQMTGTAWGGDVPGAFRLSLLPPLASAAALAYKITGSNKGIW